MCIDFSPDFRFLVSGGCDGQLVFWDLATNQIYRRFRTGENGEAKPNHVYDV